MAFSAVLRRSSLIGPLYTFRQPKLSKRLLSKEALQSRILFPFAISAFSSKISKPRSDTDLLSVIDSEIKCAQDCDDYDKVEELPEGFPFEIENVNGKSTVTLKRSYHGEKIEVMVYMPSLVTGEEPEFEKRADHTDDEGEKGMPSQSSIPLIINVSKNEGDGLEFCCTAYPDEFVIDSMSFKEKRKFDDELLAYKGPDFSDLEENAQRAFQKYLELRGISAMSTNFLHEYMINKDSREYLLWLRDLRKLIEK